VGLDSCDQGRLDAPRAGRDDDVKAHARVSIAQLVTETCLSERSIRRAIRALEAFGVLSRVGPDEFEIDVDALDAMPKVSNGA
jgi:hypothetical protein